MSLIHRTPLARRRSSPAPSRPVWSPPAVRVRSRRRRPTTSAPHWLGRQLTDGLVHNDQFDFDDYGLTVDVGFALAAIGATAARCASIRNGARHARRRARPPASTSAAPTCTPARRPRRSSSPRPSARDPRRSAASTWSRGSQRWSSTAGPTDGPDPGRLHQRRLRQHHRPGLRRARALATAGSDARPPALKFLLEQQCRGGYFRLDFTRQDARPTRPATAATDRPARPTPTPPRSPCSTCSRSSADRPRSRAAVGKAVTWLRKTQQAERQLRRWPVDRGQQRQQHGPGRLGARRSADYCADAARAARWVREAAGSGDVSGTPWPARRAPSPTTARR